MNEEQTVAPAASGPRPAASIAARLDTASLSRAHLVLVAVLSTCLMLEFMELFVTTITMAAVLEPGSSLELSDGGRVRAEDVRAMSIAFFISGAIGATILGKLAARFGPMRVIASASLGFGTLSLLAGLVDDFTQFTIARAATAFMLAGIPPLVVAVLADSLPVAERGRVIMLASAWGTCGIPFSAAVTYLFGLFEPFGLEGWRCGILLAGLGGIVIAPFILRQPESPRWLHQSGRALDAERVVEHLTRAPAVRGWLVGRPIGTAVSTAPPEVLRADNASVTWSRRPIAYVALFSLFTLLGATGVGGFNQLNTLIMRQKGFALGQSIQYTALTFVGMPIGVVISTFILDRFERRTLVATMSVVLAVLGLVVALTGSLVIAVLAGFGWTLLTAAYMMLIQIYGTETIAPQDRHFASGIIYAVYRLSSGLVPFLLLPLLFTSGATTLFIVIAVMLAANAVLALVFGPRSVVAAGLRSGA